jgi:hypothetical protein
MGFCVVRIGDNAPAVRNVRLAAGLSVPRAEPGEHGAIGAGSGLCAQPIWRDNLACLRVDKGQRDLVPGTSIPHLESRSVHAVELPFVPPLAERRHDEHLCSGSSIVNIHLIRSA